jgi:hypothetical protein
VRYFGHGSGFSDAAEVVEAPTNASAMVATRATSFFMVPP